MTRFLDPMNEQLIHLTMHGADVRSEVTDSRVSRGRSNALMGVVGDVFISHVTSGARRHSMAFSTSDKARP